VSDVVEKHRLIVEVESAAPPSTYLPLLNIRKPQLSKQVAQLWQRDRTTHAANVSIKWVILRW